MNNNWPKWIIASFNKSFEAKRQSTPFFIEGMEKKNVDTYFELRLDGPIINEKGLGEFNLLIYPNLLIYLNYNSKDLYKLEKLITIGLSMFTKAIQIYKYGDDNSFLECAIIKSEIKINKFGELIPPNRLMCATIEATYLLELLDG